MTSFGAPVYRLASIVFGGALIFVVTYRFASAPNRPNERLGRRGLKRMDAIARSESFAAVEPLVRWFGVRLGAFMPEGFADHLDKQILYAGDYLGLLASELVAICFLSSIVGAIMGAVVGWATGLGGLAAVGFATAGAVGPYIQLLGLAEERRHRIARALPYAVDALTLAMSAGLDFPGAVRQYVLRADPRAPLTEELSYLLQNLNLGHTRRAGLEELAVRVPTEVVRELVHAVVQAEEKGTPLGEVLTIQATVSRQRRSTLAEELAAKAGVKLAAPLAILMLSLVALLIAPLLLKTRSMLTPQVAAATSRR
ncbi:MAG: type II secretion system F family protein [Labilithrix sp.]|nr:type II secretion system F family protein [Labilithrix sp.]